jgi:hypothetical protein
MIMRPIATLVTQRGLPSYPDTWGSILHAFLTQLSLLRFAISSMQIQEISRCNGGRLGLEPSHGDMRGTIGQRRGRGRYMPSSKVGSPNST